MALNRAGMLCLGLVAANLAAWGWAGAMFHGHPVLLGTALLAWGLGLRHALDADHIAAIDGATRKLMQAGQRPLGVGLFFALGHSSVVVLASLAVAAAFAGSLEAFGAVGGVFGAVVSILFLLAIAAMNAAIMRGVWRSLRAARAGVAPVRVDPMAGGGMMASLCRPLFRLVRRSWHMAPLGFLFGLGFDTAGSVAVLGVAASPAAVGLPVWSIMVFPALFMAGMVLVDTLDGLLMVRAFDWALADPVRRLRYNLAVTGVSVLAAAGVAAVGIVTLLGEQTGVLESLAAALDGWMELAGVAIVAVFAALWLGAVAASRGRAARQA